MKAAAIKAFNLHGVSRKEFDRDFKFRKLLFYPLNYGTKASTIVNVDGKNSRLCNSNDKSEI